MPDLMMDVLEWIKDKPDIAEVLYENKNINPPILVHVVKGESRAAGAASNSKKIFYAKAPTIGKVTYKASSVKAGASVSANEALGFIQGEGERLEFLSPAAGKLEEILVADGSHVGFGEPLLLLEQN